MKSFFQIVLLRLDLASSNSCFHFHSASKASGKGTDSDLYCKWLLVFSFKPHSFMSVAWSACGFVLQMRASFSTACGYGSPTLVDGRACVFCVISSLYMKFLGVYCNEMDAVMSLMEVCMQMLSLQTRKQSFLEGGGFYELWLDFQSTYSISQKFNSTTSAAWRTCCRVTRW